MQSLFSRARTASTPKLKDALSAGAGGATDEFGRVRSRGADSPVPPRPSSATTSGKKSKKKDKDGGAGGPEAPALRARTMSSPRAGEYDADSVLGALPDGAFLPLNLDPLPSLSTSAPDAPPAAQPDYGLLSHRRHVVLGPGELERLTRALCAQLAARGLTTAFVFSSLALDAAPAGARRLVDAFLRTCAPGAGRDAAPHWDHEARFAGIHELGMALRWGLARAVRVVGGQEVRGILDYGLYAQWRDAEHAANYPPAHFDTLLPLLPPLVRSTLLALLSLLAQLTAHSASSGHTPPTLSPLFGPLLFGLGPAPALSFAAAYDGYLRAAHAAEHVLLAYVRAQDAAASAVSGGPGGSGGAAAALGVPAKLKDWIRGYPSTLAAHAVSQISRKDQGGKAAPRRGARTVRVVGVKRTVRMYTPDLVRSAAGWATPVPASAGKNALAASRDWQRVAARGLPPRYADSYRKRMDLPAHVHPDTSANAASAGAGASSSIGGTGAPGSPGSLSAAPSASSSLSSSTASTLVGSDPGGGEGEFKSLTDFKWGEFENMGFGGLVSGNDRKLQFDLTESARAARHAKRQTLSWDDFSSAGFSRADDPLSGVLQFSAPVLHTVSAWPAHQEEIRRKLKKAHKALPAFGWDTDPVLGAEEWVEEAFVDCFCDLIYGGGWMDLERREETDRDCNWALIEFKCLPLNVRPEPPLPAGVNAPNTPDPRTSTVLMLFEEFVPAEYRAALAAAQGGSSKRSRLNFFRGGSSGAAPASGGKTWKQAPTLNGRPYVPGAAPAPPSGMRDVDFDAVLRDKGTRRLASGSPAPGLPPSPAPGTVLGAGAQVVSGIPLMPRLGPAWSDGLPVPGLGVHTPVPGPPTQGRLAVATALSHPGFFHPPPADLDSPMTPGKSVPVSPLPVAQSTSKKGSRFRLGGGGSGNGGSGEKPDVAAAADGRRVPAVAQRLEFETRLASYSDEDLPGGSSGAGGKHAKRRSRDDAWVDILVSSSERRLGGQDADPSRLRAVAGRTNRAGRSDPELASQEVAAVLRAVEELPPSDDEDDIDVEVIRPMTAYSDVRTSADDGGDGDYTDTDARPSTDGTREDGATDEDGAHGSSTAPAGGSLAALRARAGAGYFAQHPDRRPTSGFEDPRARLAHDADSDDDAPEPYHPPPAADEDSPYGRLQNRSPAPPAPRLDGASPTTPTMPVPQPAQAAPAPAFPVPVPNFPATPLVSRVPKPVAAPAAPAAPAPEPAPAGPAEKVSKTAALISMYREREQRGRTGNAAPGQHGPMPTNGLPATPQSKLPVRVGSASPGAPGPAVAFPVPEPAAAPAAAAKPKLLPPADPPARVGPGPSPLARSAIDPPLDPPKRDFDRRAATPSPQRYVHGAPLHNVLEEEEEEV